MQSLDKGFFARHPWAAVALLLAAYAFVSTMDYQDARMEECAARNQSYDKETDKCR